jgi:hypothetical protein
LKIGVPGLVLRDQGRNLRRGEGQPRALRAAPDDLDGDASAGDAIQQRRDHAADHLRREAQGGIV